MGFGIHSQVRVKSLKVGSRLKNRKQVWLSSQKNKSRRKIEKQEMGMAFKSEKQSVWALVFKVEKNRKWVWFPRQEKNRKWLRFK